MPRELDRARRYFRLCAAAGHADCQVRLAKLLLGLPQREEREYVQAIAWLQLAADQGNSEARDLVEMLRRISMMSRRVTGRIATQMPAAAIKAMNVTESGTCVSRTPMRADFRLQRFGRREARVSTEIEGSTIRDAGAVKGFEGDSSNVWIGSSHLIKAPFPDGSYNLTIRSSKVEGARDYGIGIGNTGAKFELAEVRAGVARSSQRHQRALPT